MKNNLLQYLRDAGNKSFRELPFSPVDALVLAQLSYLKMDGIVPGFGSHDHMLLADILAHPDHEHLFADPLYGKIHRKVFSLVCASRRYSQVRADYFSEWLDEEKEVQFAAVTFFLGETSIFISYRGTDETLVGWKEDFNMGYMREVPSQKKALAYLKGVARYCGGCMILGGHSKGGNLAVYAAARAPEHIQRRIRRIYSFDGPGFRRGFYETSGFLRMEDRYCKIVPEQSLIGMLLANYRKYRVVESYKRGMVQHDLMQWKIRDGKFVYRKDLYRRSDRKTAILNDWIDSLTGEQIASFVETLYELLCSARVKDVSELLKGSFRVTGAIWRSFGRMDRGRKKAFLEVIGKLFAAAGTSGRRKKDSREKEEKKNRKKKKQCKEEKAGQAGRKCKRKEA